MSFSLPAITSRLASGNFENLQSDRAAVLAQAQRARRATSGNTDEVITATSVVCDAAVRAVEVAYAKGCLHRVRMSASASFWEELENLTVLHRILPEELGTDRGEMLSLSRKVDVERARWAFSCFRGSLSPVHLNSLKRVMAGRRVRYADIGTSREEVQGLERRYRAVHKKPRAQKLHAT